ncbi:MAG: hypothetical protein IJJ33_14475 [Victivallales bacterium]|nr:hypothetical protein [Victivallales bacterium]
MRFRDAIETGKTRSVSDLVRKARMVRARHRENHRGRKRPRWLHAQTLPSRHPRQLGRAAPGLRFQEID